MLNDLKREENGAGQRLYTRYSGHLMAVGLRYMGNGEDAADVVQDALVKILTNIQRFEYRGEGTLRAWMARIVVNTALKHLQLRAHFFHEELPENLEPDEDTDVVLVPPEVLMKMIGELPKGYRTVLNLYVFEKMSHQEIARELGIKENSSASQYLRAKRLLQQKIKDYINTPNLHREEKI